MTGNCIGGFRLPFLIRCPRASGRTTVRVCLACEFADRGTKLMDAHRARLGAMPACLDLSALAALCGSGAFRPVNARRAERREGSHVGLHCAYDRS